MAQDSPRRDFLKMAAGAALTTSLFSRPSIAFIGCGSRGSRNMNYAAQSGGAEIVGVCDVSRPALENAAAQARRLGFPGVKRCQDFREVLADRSIDAVAIATPAEGHAYLTVEACKAGKDVWCETPVCLSVEEGVRMVQAARKYGRVVQAGTVQRSSSIFRKTRETIQGGEIGDITFCRVHQFDLVPFVFREAMPLSISAQGGNFMLATFRYRDFLAAFESRAGQARGTVFHGARATLTVNREGYRIFPAAGSKEPAVWKGRDATDPHVAHWNNFLECLRTRRRPVSDIETCVRSTTACLLANLALRHGVNLDWDEQAFTVKQREIQPLLKARHRSPWKLEV